MWILILFVYAVIFIVSIIYYTIYMYNVLKMEFFPSKKEIIIIHHNIIISLSGHVVLSDISFCTRYIQIRLWLLLNGVTWK